MGGGGSGGVVCVGGEGGDVKFWTFAWGGTRGR